MITLDQQVKCVEDEVKRREKMFPHLVASEKMTQEKATYELEVMKAIYRTLTQFRGIAG